MAAEDRSDDQRPDGAVKQKKPYEPPRLSVYGDIAAVTRTVGMSGMLDGGMKGNAKATQP
jgi:hypothetical protein